MNNCIVAAVGIESNSAGIPHSFLSISKRDVVADQVVTGSIGQADSMVSVVIGGIPTDRGIGVAVEVDALTG